MGLKGKVQITMLLTVPAGQVAEGDRLFGSHGEWIEATHPRSGETALLAYSVSKGPGLTNPLDPGSQPTGNTTYVVDEVYESEAGVANHWRLGAEGWTDFSAFVAWASGARATVQHRGAVINALAMATTAGAGS